MIRDPTRVISSLNPISDDEEWWTLSLRGRGGIMFWWGFLFGIIFHGDNLRNLPSPLWMSRPATHTYTTYHSCFFIFIFLVPWYLHSKISAPYMYSGCLCREKLGRFEDWNNNEILLELRSPYLVSVSVLNASKKKISCFFLRGSSFYLLFVSELPPPRENGGWGCEEPTAYSQALPGWRGVGWRIPQGLSSGTFSFFLLLTFLTFYLVLYHRRKVKKNVYNFE